MKKLLLTLPLLFSAVFTFGQGCIYHEDMEVIDSISSSNLPSSGLPGWNADAVYFHSGVQSYHGTFGVDDSSIATTISINLTGNTFVILNFWHICKLQFFDEGIVQVSNDGGNTWTKLTNLQYLGTSNFAAQGNKFTEAAYPIWFPGLDTIATPATQGPWWQFESFDISALVGNVPDAKIRWVAHDLNHDGLNRFGWLLDDICVVAAPCELTPPVVYQAPPIFSGTVFNNGPYTYSVKAGDNSGIASVFLVTSLNGGPNDTILMSNPALDSLWTVTPPDTFAVGDSICYHFFAFDASACANLDSTLQNCFVVSDGTHLPFCDNFDTGNLWSDSTVSGSDWQLGTPNFGQTNTAHSPPNSWDIDLNNAYQNNTETYLTSPIFDFSIAVNSKVNFWINFNAEGSWDGARLDYSTDGGSTWQIVGSFADPNATNWYTYASINSSGQPAWSGSSASITGNVNGWVNAIREMVEPDFDHNPNPIMFRFVFTSDPSVIYDGVSIDDFCVKLPQPQDVGVSAILLPNSIYPSGANGDVKLLIKNYGLNSATNFDVYYVYGGPPVVTNYPGTLAAGSVDTVFGPQFIVLPGTQNFCAYTDLTGDGDHTNDTLCMTVSGIQQVNITYCNNFDSSGNDWTPIPSPVGNTNWELGTPNFGLTNSPHSAPNAWDVNLNTGYDFGAETYLLSPIFDFSTACNARMEFWQNCNTQSFWDGARIDINLNGNGWNVLGTIADPLAVNWYTNAALFSSSLPGWDGNSNGWIKCSYNMNGYSAIGLIQIRYAFNSTNFTTGDGISIDDFCMINPPADDIGVSAIINPTPIWGAGQLSPVNLQIHNYGCNPVTNFDVYYTYTGSGGPIGPTTYSGPPIPPNGDTVVACAQFIVPSGIYDFCGYTVLATDGDHTNDTLCFQPKGIPVVPIPYCNNFDSSAADWTPVASQVGITNWELGTPNYGLTNSAHSSPNAWDVNLNTGYDFGAETYLLSPIFDFSTACNARMEFWQNRNTQVFYDGGRMDLNINGLGWNVLGTVGDPLAVNWYTNAALFSSNQPGWDGNSNGWVKCSYNMNAYSAIGLIQIRYGFNSSNFTIGDGMSIDDFCMINPPGDDIGVDAIRKPAANWGAGQLSDVTLRVRNYGCNPITNFDVYYTYTGGPGPVGPVTYAGPAIQPNDTVLISCAQFVVPSGIYDFCGYTVMATDGDNSNDTLCEQHKGVPVDTLNYCDNFDGATANDWTAVTNTPGSAWQLGTPAFGATTGAHSAPNAWDINLTTAYQPNANAELLSPFFDMSQAVNAHLSFWQNRNVETNWDGTRIDVDSNGSGWSVLGFAGDPLGTNWYTNNALISSGLPGWDGNSTGWVKSEYIMTAYNNVDLLQLRFVFTSDPSVQYDGFSIDDLCLRVPPPQDAGCNNILSPVGSLVVGNNYFPSFSIKNYGSANIDTIPVTYTINGGAPVTQIYYPVIIPNGSGIINFTTGFSAIPGAFTLCIYTDLPSDGDHFNDSCCITLIGVPTIIPTYTDSFDGVNAGWTTNNIFPANQWQLGVPNFGQTTGAHSPPNCWDVNLNTGYIGQSNCELISPYFDFTNVINAEISFWLNWNTEANWDGTRIDYSTDGGSTFSTLGAVGCTSCLNWYTNPFINSSGKPAWDGSSGGWKFAKDSDLTFLNGISGAVVFKFIFTSDFSVDVDGVSVDDFTLYKPITLTAGTNDVHAVNNILTPGPQYITGRYKNFGTTPLNSVVVTLTIDGAANFIVTDTINPIPSAPLNYGQQALHTFSMPWNASPGQHLMCIYTSYPNNGADLDNSDDTTCAYLTVFDSTSVYPYCNNFETGPVWPALNSVTYQPTSSWQLGHPAKPNLSGPFSGNNCWVTDLTLNYPNNDESSLFSPVFNVQYLHCYELKFWQNFDMDLFNDGGTVELSTDSGISWQQFGQAGDQLNWMNASYVAAFGSTPPLHAGWTGFLGGWVESKHNYCPSQNGTVIFRWRFASDASNTADGWAIDDVCFTEIPYPAVTDVETLSTDFFYLFQNTPNPASDVTHIKFSLPSRGKAELKVTNVIGQVIDIPVKGTVESGMHTVNLNIHNLAPGVYYYKLSFEGKTITRKMIITK